MFSIDYFVYIYKKIEKSKISPKSPQNVGRDTLNIKKVILFNQTKLNNTSILLFNIAQIYSYWVKMLKITFII